MGQNCSNYTMRSGPLAERAAYQLAQLGGSLMKKLLLANVAGATLIVAGSAHAADLGVRAPHKAPPPVAAPVSVFSWTGCYVGAQGGWGWGRKRFEHDEIGGDPGISESTTDISGAVFGGQAGCDYQFAGGWVIGIAGDAFAADINGVGLAPEEANELFGPPRDTLGVKTDFLASITGRLGYSFWNTVLAYVKGGGAWAHDRYDFHNASELADLTFQDTVPKESRTGWTVGGGFEWAFAPNWSARVEFDYYDFGSKSHGFTFTDFNGLGPETFIATIKQQIETLTIGVNYHFNLFGKAPAPIMARY
jgi:outer membrane immunogenic protein